MLRFGAGRCTLDCVFLGDSDGRPVVFIDLRGRIILDSVNVCARELWFVVHCLLLFVRRKGLSVIDAAPFGGTWLRRSSHLILILMADGGERRLGG